MMHDLSLKGSDESYGDVLVSLRAPMSDVKNRYTAYSCKFQ